MPRQVPNWWSSSLPPPETREWLLEPSRPRNGPSRKRTSVLSALYDSRQNPGGIGFPPAAANSPGWRPTTSDPHDYYAEIGVARDATSTEIRSAVRGSIVSTTPTPAITPTPRS